MATTKETKTEKKPETAIVHENGTKAITAFDYGDDQGKGYENQTSADVAVPIWKLLQPMNPEVLEKRKDPVTGQVAEAGLWYHTTSGSVRQALIVVPATTRHVYVEWTPRDEGGGYRGQHAIDSKIVFDAIKESKNFGEYFAPQVEGETYRNLLKETYYVFAAICDDKGGAEGMGLISFESSKIRSYKAWMGRMKPMLVPGPSGKKQKPPLYAHLTVLTSEIKKFDDGSAFIPVINSYDPRGMMYSLLGADDERFQMAKACKELVDSGEAKVNFEAQTADDPAKTDAEGKPLPF